MTGGYGPITQIAWVSIEAPERTLSGQFGIGRWTRLPGTHFGPHDRPVDYIG